MTLLASGLHPSLNHVRLLLRRLVAPLGLLETVKDVDRYFNLNSVEGAVGMGVKVGDDLEDSGPAKSLGRLRVLRHLP
jgi:hypothetical protein